MIQSALLKYIFRIFNQLFSGIVFNTNFSGFDAIGKLAKTLSPPPVAGFFILPKLNLY